MNVSSQIEDYLKGIYRLQTRHSRVPTSVLAGHLDVSPPSVTGMVQKLTTLGLVEHEPYHGVRLTHDGEALALKIVRAHRLWESYLVEVLELPWDEAHLEAEHLEHVLSEALADRLDMALDHPTIDPHGHPIPSRNGRMPPPSGVPLTELLPEEKGIILQIRDETPELLRYLGKMGIYPGESITVREVAPFNGPIHAQVAGVTQALGRQAAEHVVVERLTPASENHTTRDEDR
jgi:DtxR family Mn-dependent transcriptional regulator